MDYVYFDLESTGTNPYKDRIVEIGMVRGGTSLETLVNPGRPILEEATEVHGISDKDVEAAPTMIEVAAEVAEMLAPPCTLVGYNIRTFDTPLLTMELARCDVTLGLLDYPEIDLYVLWRELESRSLRGALKRFLGIDPQQAHRAIADVENLPDLLPAMLEEIGNGEAWDELPDLCRPADEVDREGRLKVGEDGRIVFAFGKHEGEPINRHHDYLRWMLKQDFNPEVRRVIRRELGQLGI